MEVKRSLLKNKRLLLIAIMTYSACLLFAQNDLIILRDGTEKKVKINMVNNEATLYVDKDDKSLEKSVPNNQIYLIKYAKRGNVFFTEDGKRISEGEEVKQPSNTVIIYLIEGREIFGYDLKIETDKVVFKSSKKKGTPISYIPKDKIFLIKYPDGTKDIFNDLDAIKKKREHALAEKARQEERARIAKQIRSYPKDATILTIKDVVIKASIIFENKTKVLYKRTDQKSSPIYHMNRSNIRGIMFNK